MSKRCIRIFLLIGLFLVTVMLSPVLAHPNLSKSENNLNHNYISSETFLTEGQSLYEAGKFSEAIKVLKQGINVTNQGLERAVIFSNLSLAYQQLGLWQEAENSMAHSLNIFKNMSDSPQKSAFFAQSLDIQGRLQLAKGQEENALSTWQQAADIYQQISDSSNLIRNQINQASVWQSLGHYLQAEKTLTQVKNTLATEPDSLVKATALRSLGNVLSIVGNLEESKQILEESLAVATALSSNQGQSEAFLSLGNTAFAQQQMENALNFYQQAVSFAINPTIENQAYLNQLKVLIEIPEFSTAKRLAIQLKSKITDLPPSRIGIYAKINLARNLIKMRSNTSLREISDLEIAQLISSAITQAQALEDSRSESYALGTLGLLYEQTEQLKYAQSLTEKALIIAEKINALDIAYQWQWQLGRLLKLQKQKEQAIAYYDQAVTTLESLRGDIVRMDNEIRFSFREEIEPVYRELVDLLLKKEQDSEPSPENILQARNTIELLQLAELNNFFRAPCLEAKTKIDQLVDQDATVAVFYPIILPDRLEIIFKLPQQPLRHYATFLPEYQIENVFRKLQYNLVRPNKIRESQFLGQKVYQWIIEPVKEDLKESKIKTLVFVSDSSLRNLPMAALYDGQQYLIEQYSISLSSGLQLIEPQSLKEIKLKALTGGITEPLPGFLPLEYVATELEEISSKIPSRKFLNQKFTTKTLENEIETKPFSIVHLATHGQFSSDPNQTFILAWDRKIKLREFEKLLKIRQNSQTSPIELLVLSACQTAVGDKRAALGLAGVAIQAGARSTLASLWNIDDASTSLLMKQFYQELISQNVTKAEALRRAQVSLLKNDRYQSPLFWAAYVLVGNWL